MEKYNENFNKITLEEYYSLKGYLFAFLCFFPHLKEEKKEFFLNYCVKPAKDKIYEYGAYYYDEDKETFYSPKVVELASMAKVFVEDFEKKLTDSKPKEKDCA